MTGDLMGEWSAITDQVEDNVWPRRWYENESMWIVAVISGFFPMVASTGMFIDEFTDSEFWRFVVKVVAIIVLVSCCVFQNTRYIYMKNRRNYQRSMRIEAEVLLEQIFSNMGEQQRDEDQCPKCDVVLQDLSAQSAHMLEHHPDLVAERRDESKRWDGWTDN